VPRLPTPTGARGDHRKRGKNAGEHVRDLVVEVMRYYEDIQGVDKYDKKRKKVRQPTKFDKHR
jgi:hypothetical protein